LCCRAHGDRAYPQALPEDSMLTPDPGQLLTRGAQKIGELIGRYLASGQRQRERGLAAIRHLHQALLDVDADYRVILVGLLELLEDIAAEPDRVAAKLQMRQATRTLRQQREKFDAARLGIRASIRQLMLFTKDPQIRHYLWAVAAYMLDEDPGLGFPANVPATVQTLLDRDIGAVARTPSSVVLNALENGNTPDQIIAVVQHRREQMKRFLDYAIDTYAYLMARELK